MADDLLPDSAATQTQTQNSQIDWSQPNTPAFIPTIWGRLYSTKVAISGKHCWKNAQYPEYFGKNFTYTYHEKKMSTYLPTKILQRFYEI